MYTRFANILLNSNNLMTIFGFTTFIDRHKFQMLTFVSVSGVNVPSHSNLLFETSLNNRVNVHSQPHSSKAMQTLLVAGLEIMCFIRFLSRGRATLCLPTGSLNSGLQTRVSFLLRLIPDGPGALWDILKMTLAFHCIRLVDPGFYFVLIYFRF